MSGINLMSVRRIENDDRTHIQLGPVDWDFALAVDKRLLRFFEQLKAAMWSDYEILRGRALLLGSIAYLPRL
ncbi:hypothetical protein AMST5_03884 [freshwater sediment metagenome]|uniref:Uncharacterized protein n=1 Tax=freshwater sediment metagenome TaxID=556182 RepID=A0AA48M686_9ZZZZ